MLLFLIVFYFFAVLSLCEEFAKVNKGFLKITLFITMIILVVLTSIRGGETADYEHYRVHFDYIISTEKVFVSSNFVYEPLWCILIWCVKKIWNNYQFFVFVIGFISMFLQYKAAKILSDLSDNCQTNNCKKTKTHLFTFFLISWGLYNCNIFVIRNTIAILLCLCSIKYIQEKKPVRFVVFVLLATGFHYSALCFILAYWLYHYKGQLSKKMLWLIFGTIAGCALIKPMLSVISRLGLGSISTKLGAYLESAGNYLAGTGFSQTSAMFSIAKTLINIAVVVVMGVYIYRYYKDNEKYKGYLNLYLFGCIVYVASMTIGRAFARISIYFNYFQIPMALFFVSKKKNRWISWSICVLYVLLRMIINLREVEFIPFWIN